ncbi:transglutaminase family protein [Niabella terrae]
MKYNVSCMLSYTVHSRAEFVFSIQAAVLEVQQVLEEELILSPEGICMEAFEIPGRPERLVRIRVDQPCYFTIGYRALVDSRPRILQPPAPDTDRTVTQLSPAVLPYLFPSRYCQSDRLFRFVQMEFESAEGNYARVEAICDWIYKNVSYVSGSTNTHTSALETISERQGVCRDFAHLGIAFCRALSIPARYFTGFAYQLLPQDFHACFEAYIGGQWIVFDPTRMVPLEGLVKTGHGLDAADAAFANIFGDATPVSVQVDCTAMEDETPDPPAGGHLLSFS